MLQLISKRNKLFFRSNAEEVPFVLDNRSGVQPAPDWVKDTLGYKQGVRDKSIIDLTPTPKDTKQRC